MKKSEFWTYVLINGEEKKALMVSGTIDKKRGFGIYKQNYDGCINKWYAVDLKSGLAFLEKHYKKDIIENLEEGIKKLEKNRAGKEYKKTCLNFRYAILNAGGGTALNAVEAETIWEANR
jgi:20S proteasome alpha/beta subunit